eukprot:TRINITY_DN15475_c0_g1_i4.p1 TRINITY_DN15475_c0_g1~~TRINITY_DN15475_c0_g1_i4.p1  ORF type:complete len:397 (-),score=171.57 TRINITY_DN15475_c0_g1_i4:50-1240(-)
MKETPVSICEKNFLLEGLWEGKRLDGRNWLEERKLEMTFGKDWGSCQVNLGRTIVLAQVSAQVTEPRVARPNEGILMVNVELSPIAAPKFDVGRMTEEGVEINRTIERCLKESRCLDLESLCIISEEKVWTVRLDLHILNHCGNLTDACSVAGLAALCHFRRPDVTLKGDLVTVHPITERDPVPLAVHHHPVTSTFAMFQMAGTAETLAVCDPSRLEEECMGGKMVIGVNAYREICTLHLAGQVLVDKKLVLKLTNTAAEKAKKMVEKIKQSLAKEEELRKSGAPRGFAASLQALSIMQNNAEKKEFDFSKVSKEAKSLIKQTQVNEEVHCQVSSGDNCIDVIPDTMEGIDSDDDNGDDLEITAEKTRAEVLDEKVTDHIDLNDSEEEETVTLTTV